MFWNLCCRLQSISESFFWNLWKCSLKRDGFFRTYFMFQKRFSSINHCCVVTHQSPEGSLKISITLPGIKSLPERDGSLKRDGTLSLSVATRGTNGDPRITRCRCGGPSHLDCRRLQGPRRRAALNVRSVTALLKRREAKVNGEKGGATRSHKNDVTRIY